ncbi:hypothetical protein D3C81_2279830 [compost metagenome]
MAAIRRAQERRVHVGAALAAKLMHLTITRIGCNCGHFPASSHYRLRAQGRSYMASKKPSR